MRTTIGRAALGGALTAALAAAAAAPAAADFEIHVKGNGQIARIGDLRNPGDADLATATRVFGRPAGSPRADGPSCPARWPGLGLRILFVDLGGGNPCTREGDAQTATVTTARWSTARGLHVGDGARKLERLYPRAKRRGGVVSLVGRPSPFGPPGTIETKLGARVADGRVKALEVWIGGAGE